jgi:hypothetical protein
MATTDETNWSGRAIGRKRAAAILHSSTEGNPANRDPDKESVMEKKICELKLNEIDAVVGGVLVANSTSTTVYKAPSFSWPM